MGFEPIKKKVVLSIDNPSMSQYIEIKQGFIGTLELIISFLYQGKTFEIPEGTTAQLRMLKPDKSQVLNSCEVIGNNVVVKVTYQMQRAPGDGSFEIILINEGEAIPSSTCNITIISNVHNDSNIESTDEYISVIESLSKVNEAVTKANTATNSMNELIDLVQTETLRIYKEYVNTFDDIAITYPNPEIGWTTKVMDTGDWYRYNGKLWIRFDNDTDNDNNDKVGDLSKSTNNNKENVVSITNELNENKLDKTGDATNTTVTINEAITDEEITDGTLGDIIGKVKKNLASITENIGDTNSALQEIAERVGDLSNLETESNADLVGAVNEVKNNLGNKSTLSTTAKSSIVAAINELVNSKANISISTNFTLSASSWTGDTAPYTYTLQVDGATESSAVEILPQSSLTTEQVDAMINAIIANGIQSNDSITLYAYGDKPNVDLPITIIIRGDM